MIKSDLLAWGIILGIIIVFVLGKTIKKQRTRKILKRAKSGEKKAISFMEQHGYRVIELQSRKKIITEINGTAHESTIIADMIVRKGLFKYIVEVKTQGQASPTLPNVRRQMMEYYLMFQPHGVIFLDMDRGKMRMVKFKGAMQKQTVIKLCMLCFFLGILTVIGYSHFIA